MGIIGVSSFFAGRIISVSSFFAEKRTDTNNPPNNPPTPIIPRRLNTSRHIVFNLSRPDKSLILLAPLARDAGGWELCRDPKSRKPAPVFSSTGDPDYQKLLAMCVAGKQYLEQVTRFNMPGFRPRGDWVRELKRFGILTS